MKVQFRNRSETQAIYNLKVTASTDTKAVQPLRNSWYFSSVAPGETVAIEDGVKVAMATEDTSAVLSFGHDLIEDKKTEEDLQDMVQEEVRRQLAEKNQ